MDPVVPGEGESTPAVEAAPEVADTPVADAPAAEVAPEARWNGEMASIEEQPWWADVPEANRDTLRQGMQAKYQNWNQGYTKKMQDLADQRIGVEEAQASADRAMSKAKQFLYGDHDPLVEKDVEIEELKSKLGTLEAGHQSALRTLQEENTRQLREAAAQGEQALAAVRQEASTSRAQLDRIQAAEVAAQTAAVDQQQTALQTRIDAEAPDIMENDAAFFAFAGNLRMGHTFEDSLAMTRVLHPGPSKPETSNPGEDLMSAGGAGPGPQRGKTETLDEVLKRNKSEEGSIWRAPR